MEAIKTSFGDFASQVHGFNALSQNDRSVLLRTNVKLFKHYILGNSFNAASLQDQLKWIMLSSDAAAPEGTNGAMDCKGLDEMLVIFKVEAIDLSPFMRKYRMLKYAKSGEIHQIKYNNCSVIHLSQYSTRNLVHEIDPFVWMTQMWHNIHWCTLFWW